MDKVNTSTTQKTEDKTEMHEKTLHELKEELSLLSRKLDTSQSKLAQLIQKEEVLKKQDTLLEIQAQDLNDRIIFQRMKLEDMRRQSEANVENFVQKINRVLEKNRHLWLEANGKKEEGMREREKRRRRYHELMGEREALLVYKEYQQCVLDELQKLDCSRVPGM